MRTFDVIGLDPTALSDNLDELEELLSVETHLRERNQILPFFKARPHLCAALGYSNNAVQLPDRWASELDLFGDFACDAAAGDSEVNAYTLIEFEDALEYSIFSKLPSGKVMKHWSPRFEHGFSQLVDWAWRLSGEGEASDAFRRVFGDNNSAIHLTACNRTGCRSDQRRSQEAKMESQPRLSRSLQDVLLHFRWIAAIYSASSFIGKTTREHALRRDIDKVSRLGLRQGLFRRDPG